MLVVGGCGERVLGGTWEAPGRHLGGTWEAPEGSPFFFFWLVATGPEIRSQYLAWHGRCSTPAVGTQASVLDRPAPSDVEGHKRCPPSKVGGLCHEFRIWGLGFRV